MDIGFWVIISEKGSVRVSRRKSGTKPNEVMVWMEMSLPEDAFETPRFSAKMKVPKGAIKTNEIKVEMPIEELRKE